MTAYLGTAGYNYPAWRGGFYPVGLPATGQLGHYATEFNFVEVNSTFYRTPTAEQLLKMRDRVGPGFRFSLKVPKAVSHDYDVTDLADFAAAARILLKLGQLAGVVLQEPETFRNTPGNRAWLIRVRELLGELPVAVEFRHRSWAEPAPELWARRHGYTVVAVGVPALVQLFPAGFRATGPRAYARLHSENADAWYAGGTARYDYDYPEPTLARWADAVADFARDGGEEAWVVFNNCVGVQAIENARRMRTLLTARGVTVDCPPPKPVRKIQGTLFDECE